MNRESNDGGWIIELFFPIAWRGETASMKTRKKGDTQAKCFNLLLRQCQRGYLTRVNELRHTVIERVKISMCMQREKEEFNKALFLLVLSIHGNETSLHFLLFFPLAQISVHFFPSQEKIFLLNAVSFSLHRQQKKNFFAAKKIKLFYVACLRP